MARIDFPFIIQDVIFSLARRRSLRATGPFCPLLPTCGRQVIWNAPACLPLRSRRTRPARRVRYRLFVTCRLFLHRRLGPHHFDGRSRWPQAFDGAVLSAAWLARLIVAVIVIAHEVALPGRAPKYLRTSLVVASVRMLSRKNGTPVRSTISWTIPAASTVIPSRTV